MDSLTPFFDRAAELSKLRARFFVPGHKGKAAALPPFAPLLPFDLTEIDGADDLSHPTGPLAESQNNMSKAFGSAASLYSAFGSTSCIEAMLHLYTRPNQPVLMARACHISALRALVFGGAVPVWLPLEEGRLSLHHLQEALQKYPEAPVYLGSFDYFGRGSDVAKAAILCQQAKAPLLVDNAHGAHLAFLQPSKHPLHLGADAVTDSAHKTLPCLTGAALLHLREAKHAARARELLNLYSSTSPSYLILESLDLCAGQLLSGGLDFEAAVAGFAAVGEKAAHLCEPSDDPLKICLRPALAGWSMQTVQERLGEQGILPEYCDGTRLVLMASVCNQEEDFEVLTRVLAQFPPRTPLAEHERPAPVLPEMLCSPREAYFAEKERLPLHKTLGRVAAGLDAPCPPGVPLLVPGERICAELLEELAYGGIFELDVIK